MRCIGRAFLYVLGAGPAAPYASARVDSVVAVRSGVVAVRIAVLVGIVCALFLRYVLVV